MDALEPLIDGVATDGSYKKHDFSLRFHNFSFTPTSSTILQYFSHPLTPTTFFPLPSPLITTNEPETVMSPLQAIKIGTLVVITLLLSAVSTQDFVSYDPFRNAKPDITRNFTIGSVDHYEGPLFSKPINANNGAYWVGELTSTSCPYVNQTQCGAVNTTVLTHSGAELVRDPFPHVVYYQED
ncbi:MAG: hypothetical protein Q9181_000934 [Wetmoreana brouardii]